MQKVSARFSPLLGDIEDCEREARNLGLTQVVDYLLAAKLEALEVYATAASRNEMVIAARAAGEHSVLIPFPSRPQPSGVSEAVTAKRPKAPRKGRSAAETARTSISTIHRLVPRDVSTRLTRDRTFNN